MTTLYSQTHTISAYQKAPPMATLFEHPDGSESALLPLKLALIVSDCLEAPATFLIVEQLAAALTAKRPCVLVGISQSFEHYNALLKKQGIQLVGERERGNFSYIDAGSLLLKHLESNAAFETELLASTFASTKSNALVVVDDFSALLHAGISLLSLIKLYRKLLRGVRQINGSLMTIYHDDAFGSKKGLFHRAQDDEFLLRSIIQLSDVWMQTRSLRAQMTGEVVVHRAPGLIGQANLVTHSVDRALQYKLEETGPNYFAKGTGKGFL